MSDPMWVGFPGDTAPPDQVAALAGPIGQAPSPDTTLWSSDHYQAPYGTYDVQTTYRWDSGTIKLPVAAAPVPPTPLPTGPGAVTPAAYPAAEIVQVYAPTGDKVVRWQARRTGLHPLIPDPFNPSAGSSPPYGGYLPPNQVLRAFSIVVQSPTLLGDGNTHEYIVSGVYAYDLVTPLAPGDLQYRLGGPPYDVSAVDTLAAADFVSSIL